MAASSDDEWRIKLAVSFATTALVLILSLGTSVLLARTLGPEGRGLLLALTFWPAVLGATFNFSMNEAIAYHVAQRVGPSGDDGFTNCIFWLTVLVACGATVATFVALNLVTPTRYREYLGIIILYASLFVPLSNFDLFCRAVLQGRGSILALNFVRIVQPGGYLALLVICMIVFGASATAAMAAALTALALSTLTGSIIIRTRLVAPEIGTIVPVAKTGWMFHKANLLVYAASEADKAIALLLLSTVDAGLFVVSVAVSAIGTNIVLESFGLMLVRDMAAAEGARGRQAVFVTNMRAAYAVLLLGNGAAALLAQWWLPLLFGDEFAAAIPTTMILLMMGVLKGARHMADKAMRATHHTRNGMVAEAVALVGVVVFGPIGALTGGVEGIAIGALISQGIAFAVMLVLAGNHFATALGALWPFQRAAILDLMKLAKRRGRPLVVNW